MRIEVKEESITSATAALRLLWRTGHFKCWRRIGIIDKELEKKGYHFLPAELGTALMRAKYLTRRGKKGSFEYVQKYPYQANISGEGKGQR